MSVKDHITKKPLFADAAVRFLFVYFANFITLGNCCILALICLPGKQNSLVILFLLYLFLKGIIQSKIIIYFAYAY